MNTKLMNEMHNRNNRLTRDCFGKLLNLLSLDGVKKYKSQMLIGAWTAYTVGNVTGQYRRIGDRCEWVHPQGSSPYNILRITPISHTQVITSTTAMPSTPGGSAQIMEWMSSGMVNLGGPVGFGYAHGTTIAYHGSTPVITTTHTTATNTNNSNVTITIPHGVTLKP